MPRRARVARPYLLRALLLQHQLHPPVFGLALVAAVACHRCQRCHPISYKAIGRNAVVLGQHGRYGVGAAFGQRQVAVKAAYAVGMAHHMQLDSRLGLY